MCISDINDNCPVFTLTGDAVSYPENEDASAADIVVRSISISDMDANPNAELTVRIENPSGITTDAFPFYLSNPGPSLSSLVSEG